MNGYRTWVGIGIAILGSLGYGDLITESEASDLINLLTQLIGLLVTIYGNYKAHLEIKALGGYRK